MVTIFTVVRVFWSNFCRCYIESAKKRHFHFPFTRGIPSTHITKIHIIYQSAIMEKYSSIVSSSKIEHVNIDEKKLKYFPPRHQQGFIWWFIQRGAILFYFYYKCYLFSIYFSICALSFNSNWFIAKEKLEYHNKNFCKYDIIWKKIKQREKVNLTL